MRGYPKYKFGDVVEFEFADLGKKSGVVAIIDRYGTFMDQSDVSYDILNKEENMLYKHCREDHIIGKIGEVPESEIW